MMPESVYNPGKKQKGLNDLHIEKIIDSIDEALAGCDRNGNINFFNSASEKRENIKRNQVLNRYVEDVYDFHGGRSLLLEAIKTGKPILDQYQEYTVNGSGIYIEIICSTVPIKDGNEIIGAVSVMKDYSKVKKLSRIIMDLQSNININQRNRITDKKNILRNTGARHIFSEIIGNNSAFQKTLEWAKSTAENNMPTLIYGETGTGKELIAQSIHNSSYRKNKPYIAINCAAIPENLLESLLFGTAKGAFTGAIDKTGLFEQAQGGTIVLDEINSMPLNLQSKLLRVIQEGSVRRLGESFERKTDARVISISNQDPLDAIKKQQLREDLYYRIAYVLINVPSLRERSDDIPVLSEHFINKYNKELSLSITQIESKLFQSMFHYSWPGNVRELEHVIASAMSAIKGNKEEITGEDLPPSVNDKFSRKTISKFQVVKTMDLNTKISRIEAITINKALQKNHGNISRTARELGIKRQTLQHKMKKHDISGQNV